MAWESFHIFLKQVSVVVTFFMMGADGKTMSMIEGHLVEFKTCCLKPNLRREFEKLTAVEFCQ